MAISLSGLSSNLDTESIITQLVSAYSYNKQKLVKAQTKLSWTQDSWKSMNTKIYNLYTQQLGTLKLTSGYNKKTSTIANSQTAKVSASSSAVSGNQTLKVSQLASSGYLTGGVVSTATTTDGKATGSTKLSDLTGMTDLSSGANFTVTIGSTTKNVSISDTTTVDQFIAKLKDAGVSASFDTKNQRFFINSKTSGKAGDFSLAASSSNGSSALAAMGLLTGAPTAADLAANPDAGSAEYKEYVKWSGYGTVDSSTGKSAWQTFVDNGYTANSTDSDDVKALKSYFDAQYSSRKTSLSSKESSITSKYNNAQTVMKNYNQNVTTLSSLNDRKSELESKLADSSITDDEKTSYQSELDQVNTNITAVNKAQEDFTEEVRNNAQTTIDTYSSYFEENNGKYTVKESEQTNFDAQAQSEVDADNNTLKSTIESEMSNKITASSNALSQMASVSNAAVKINGQDANIELNGASYTSNTNNFSINGLTIEALNVDTTGTTITTDTDVDGVYNTIKNFLKQYNSVITDIDTAYNASSSSGYEPLTDDEKDAMTDTEVEKWETKIKDSLLRRDQTLGSVSTALKTAMAKSYTINGKSYSMSSFGVNTLNYFTATENERGCYHINGDSDDTYTSSNTDKLKEAIANDPDTVYSFFSQLAAGAYKALSDKMTSSTLKSAYKVYNDKQMDKEYSEYTTKISDWEDKISTYETYYRNKFTAMESALSKLNSSTSSLSSMLG